MNGLQQDAYDAVFDEGVRIWGQEVLAQDMALLPLEDSTFAHMERMGFARRTIPRTMFGNLDEDVPALEFGGWPLFCRADFPEELAFAVVQAIDARKDTMPVDGDRLDMASSSHMT